MVPGGLPLTGIGVPAAPPVTGVTEYRVIWLPPSSLGAVQDTLADFMPGVAVTLIGAPGAVVVGLAVMVSPSLRLAADYR